MSRIYLSPPDVGKNERELLLDAFDSNWLAPVGPHVDGFEADLAALLGIDHAVAVSSGTAALHLALLSVGVGPGDEVLTSTMTFVATANAISYVGAVPTFVDSDRASWNMDPDLLSEELIERSRRGNLPKAVLVVDLYGQCADYGRIIPACREFEIPVIEDAAEALGASFAGRPAGTHGDISVFSFNGNKIITTSGGGMVVSQHGHLIEKARHLANQARDPAPHYEHSEVGYNYGMSNLLAALGRGQLRGLQERVAARRATNSFYRSELQNMGIEFMPEILGGESTFWLTCVTIDEAAFGAPSRHLMKHVNSRSIEARPVWKPMHLQPAYRNYQHLRGDVAADLFARGVCLPSGSDLSRDDLERIVAEVRSTPRIHREHGPL